jgi:hypothetical protein
MGRPDLPGQGEPDVLRGHRAFPGLDRPEPPQPIHDLLDEAGRSGRARGHRDHARAFQPGRVDSGGVIDQVGRGPRLLRDLDEAA